MDKEPKLGALGLMLLVIALSCGAFASLLSPHPAQARLFFFPIALALLQLLAHHLHRQPGWPGRLGLAADWLCVAAVLAFIVVGATAVFPTLRDAAHTQLYQLLTV